MSRRKSNGRSQLMSMSKKRTMALHLYLQLQKWAIQQWLNYCINLVPSSIRNVSSATSLSILSCWQVNFHSLLLFGSQQKIHWTKKVSSIAKCHNQDPHLFTWLPTEEILSCYAILSKTGQICLKRTNLTTLSCTQQ